MDEHIPETWHCSVCGRRNGRVRWRVQGRAVECGVAADSFRPSSDTYGHPAGSVVRCLECGHGSLASLPEARLVDGAYAEAADPVSLREEAGQVETARRGLQRVERLVPRGTLADVGCWTGSLLVAGRERGWESYGVDPSGWAIERARQRGVRAWVGELDDEALASRSYRAVAICDVLEHLADPARAMEALSKLVEPGGALYLTVPDAGSLTARALGRRWWSVLPMHLQYFTRGSIRQLVEAIGFDVVAISSHAKSFSARYYAERIGGYSPSLQRVAERALVASNQSERLVSPNFYDRMEVIATRPGQ